jgi:hypothetical protein
MIGPQTFESVFSGQQLLWKQANENETQNDGAEFIREWTKRS